jgi:sensor domain CHASE-containing protein
MLLKIALVAALGSLGLMALSQMADDQVAEKTDRKQERLEQAVAAQLQSLRDHLFKR